MRDRSFAQPEGVAEANRASWKRPRYQPDDNGRSRAVLDHVLDLEPGVIFLGHFFDPLAQLEDAAPSLPFICHDGVRGERGEHRLHVLTVDGREVRLEWFRQLRLQGDLLLNASDPSVAPNSGRPMS